jgi:hypothetical protein
MDGRDEQDFPISDFRFLIYGLQPINRKSKIGNSFILPVLSIHVLIFFDEYKS